MKLTITEIKSSADEATRVRSSEEDYMKYTVILHRSDDGISVSVPALPGCWSEGDTEDEALENIRDAIQEYLAALEDRYKGAERRELEVQPCPGFQASTTSTRSVPWRRQALRL